MNQGERLIKKLLVALSIFTCAYNTPLFSSDTLADSGEAIVTVSSERQGNYTIDSTFTGFSYEKSILSIPFFTPENTALIKLFRLLGPGILRIGGNSVNETVWAGEGSSGIHPASVDRLAKFLEAVNWKIIYGLNGTTSSTALTAEEALYACNTLGKNLYGFEIGNEPDIYHSNGLKSSQFRFPDFKESWLSYHSSIIKALGPSQPPAFSGPASGFNYKDYTVPFAEQLGGYVNLLTHHYYLGNGKSIPPPTIDRLLESMENGNNGALLKQLKAVKNAADRFTGGRYRIAEANSYYNGGAPGVSDNFGSALWALEFCFTLAQNGSSGVNFHGGGSGTGYTPIANNLKGAVLQVRPEFYGILLFSLAANGALLSTEESGPSSLLSYAVSENDGSTAVILANNSRTNIPEVTVNLPGVYTNAGYMILTSPSIDAIADTTLGGSEIDAGGAWTPEPGMSIPLAGGGKSFTIKVPSGSAILIRLY
ncbi:MAG: heparinase [Brevinematales bacterium]